MRHATLYGYQVAMDAGVVLRNQRLKTRQGLLVNLMEGAAQGWGEIAPSQSSAMRHLNKHSSRR